MAEPILLATSAIGRIELVTRAGARPALDAKFVPGAQAAGLMQTWTSYVAWAERTSDPAGNWQIRVTPDYVNPGDRHQIPPITATDERAARAWLSLLAQSWLHRLPAHLHDHR